MKGVVFTEFLEMVEERFSPEDADHILEACELASAGAYTAVGTYAHEELVQLVAQLAARTGLPAPELLRSFGERLFGRFHAAYPQFFEGSASAFEFLKKVQGYIHVEVRKLYPDAELPSFTCEEPAADRLRMVYRSSRPFADLAEGLMLGCAAHFGEKVDIERIASAGDRGVTFSITKRS